MSCPSPAGESRRLGISQRLGRGETGASCGRERVRDSVAHVFALPWQAAGCLMGPPCIIERWGVSGRRPTYERAGDGDRRLTHGP